MALGLQCGVLAPAGQNSNPDFLNHNAAWMKGMWTNVKKAMDYFTLSWDPDSNGVLTGSQPMTLDNNINGNNTWIGSLCLAALEASAKMSAVNADSAYAARCLRIRALGSRKQDSAHFTGELYTQKLDNMDRPIYVDGVLLDQMLEQYWANILDLGPLYPPEHVKTAMGSVFKCNFLTTSKNFAWARIAASSTTIQAWLSPPIRKRCRPPPWGVLGGLQVRRCRHDDAVGPAHGRPCQEIVLSAGEKLAVDFGGFGIAAVHPPSASLPRGWSLSAWQAVNFGG